MTNRHGGWQRHGAPQELHASPWVRLLLLDLTRPDGCARTTTSSNSPRWPWPWWSTSTTRCCDAVAMARAGQPVGLRTARRARGGQRDTRRARDARGNRVAGARCAAAAAGVRAAARTTGRAGVGLPVAGRRVHGRARRRRGSRRHPMGAAHPTSCSLAAEEKLAGAPALVPLLFLLTKRS